MSPTVFPFESYGLRQRLWRELHVLYSQTHHVATFICSCSFFKHLTTTTTADDDAAVAAFASAFASHLHLLLLLLLLLQLLLLHGAASATTAIAVEPKHTESKPSQR